MFPIVAQAKAHSRSKNEQRPSLHIEINGFQSISDTKINNIY